MNRSTSLLAYATLAFAGMAANAAPIYTNFITVNGAGDNAGGTTIDAVNNSGALVKFRLSTLTRPYSPISCATPTGPSPP